MEEEIHPSRSNDPALSGERVPFNRPAVVGTEAANISDVMQRKKFSGIGPFGRRCGDQLKKLMDAPGVMTTTSGSHALEMAALLCNLEQGDEVILPSFAYPTTASAFARCGARLRFVDVLPGTMNIDPAAAARAVTTRSRVVVALHYGGVPCEMNALTDLARRHGLMVVEDAAQALQSLYDGRLAGTLGDLACFSFHETKNIHCGEGGALVVNDPDLVQHAEMILEKGTDRRRFLRREVSRYSWQTMGSSFVLGELPAAFLSAQLEALDTITSDRIRSWKAYREALRPLVARGWIEQAQVSHTVQHNGHMVWIKARDEAARTQLIKELDHRGIHSVFHYVPLHSTPAGRRYGRFVGKDLTTTRDANRLLRLPIFFRFNDVDRVVTALEDALSGHRSRA